MSIAIDHPTGPKTRSAVLAIFIAFTIFFLAYVDLYMVVDQQAFRPISRAFWNTFNLSYIAFFAVVIAVLLIAVMCMLGLVRSQGSDLYNKRRIPLTMAIVAVLSAGAWWLFLTVHGFGLSVLAVLSTFGIVLVAGGVFFWGWGGGLPGGGVLFAVWVLLLAIVVGGLFWFVGCVFVYGGVARFF